jgi:hypothetical protein
VNVASRAVNAVVFKLIGTAGAVKKNGHFSVHSGGAWCLSRNMIGCPAPDISELGLKYVYNFARNCHHISVIIMAADLILFL